MLEIKEVLSRNPFVKEQNVTIDGLIAMLQEIYRYSEMEAMVYKEIKDASDNYATQLRTESQEDQTKTQEFNYLLESAKQYIYLNRKFMKHLNSIAAYHDEIETKEIVSSGHHLYISNQFKMNKDMSFGSFNYMLKSGKKINCFDDIRPQCLWNQILNKSLKYKLRN